jgi:hypothetical protein
MTKIGQTLRAALTDYEGDLIAAGKAPDTVHTRVDRAERFIKYLVGESKDDCVMRRRQDCISGVTLALGSGRPQLAQPKAGRSSVVTDNMCTPRRN